MWAMVGSVYRGEWGWEWGRHETYAYGQWVLPRRSCLVAAPILIDIPKPNDAQSLSCFSAVSIDPPQAAKRVD